MATIDLSGWEFSYGGGNSALKGTPLYTEPKTQAFASPLDLLLRLAQDRSCESSFQNQIQRWLKGNPIASQWHRQRPLIKDLPHFARYRENRHYESYHEAARAVVGGTHTPKQKLLVDGLNAEVSASAVVVPAGQVVFHGRADLSLHASRTYASFVSTTLDPTVAIYHAVKRGLANKARPVVYMLTLSAPLHAIWGNAGKLKEWELLLNAGLACAHLRTHAGNIFDVVAADIGP